MPQTLTVDTLPSAPEGHPLLPGLDALVAARVGRIAVGDLIWFHGSRVKLGPGDVLEPGAQLGVDNHPELQNNKQVSITLGPAMAIHYAGGQAASPRGYVYWVAPRGPVRADPNRLANHFLVDSAEVIAAVWP